MLGNFCNTLFWKIKFDRFHTNNKQPTMWLLSNALCVTVLEAVAQATVNLMT